MSQHFNILKVTICNHFASIWSLLFVSILLLGIVFYLRFESTANAIFGIGFLINALPALYLHLEYWLINKDEEYEIRDFEIILRKKGKEHCYKNKDIEKIIFYLSPSLYKNSSLQIFPMEGYHYAIVKLKNGDDLVLTCLLAPRIDEALKQIKGVLFERRKKMFCTLSE